MEPFIQTINLKGREIDVLRLDAIHQFVSGNKWYKLKGYLDYIQEHQLKGLVTFGGPYSNHLHATAFAGHDQGITTVAYIRGEEWKYSLTPTLQACQDLGMHLHFVNRTDYKRKNESEFLTKIKEGHPGFLIVPEGGSGDLGKIGIQQLAKFFSPKYHHIITAVGTGTTILGCYPLLLPHQHLWGFVPMKGGEKLMDTWDVSTRNFHLIDKYHFGGFGKMNNELLIYMNNLFEATQLPTDRVYTAKLFYGLEQELSLGLFPEKEEILVIHTGGLQGNVSIQDQLVF